MTATTIVRWTRADIAEAIGAQHSSTRPYPSSIRFQDDIHLVSIDFDSRADLEAWAPVFDEASRMTWDVVHPRLPIVMFTMYAEWQGWGVNLFANDPLAPCERCERAGDHTYDSLCQFERCVLPMREPASTLADTLNAIDTADLDQPVIVVQVEGVRFTEPASVTA
jgi:capsule polysaccharide export protein KpsC/LpsZ